MNTENRKPNFVAVALIAVIAIVALILLLQPRNDDPATALGRAMDDVAEGVEDAAEELDPNRTPAEKVGDAIEDLGDDIQDAGR